MAKVYDEISPALQAWIAQQHLFFVATAPASTSGMVNCSPKGLDTLRVVNPHEVAYLDLTGSGAETISHVRENGRIVLMLCALSGPLRIVRPHGTGSIAVPGSELWGVMRPMFPAHPGDRCIVHVRLVRVSDSCGYGVPLHEYAGERNALTHWAHNKGPEGLRDYRREQNAHSIDGLPALPH
jgi:hypothetical protein